MNGIIGEFIRAWQAQDIEKWTYALIWLVVGIPIAKVLSLMVFKFISRTGRAEIAMLAKRTSFLGLSLLVVFGALKELGVDLSVILGAAGILTVALGFASQTSASNVISGLFLIGERPFVAGDIIQIGNTIGVVLSIDMVSIKLRTYDNLLVRIPNESLFKSEIWNLTHYTIRRFTFYLHFSYDQDLCQARQALEEVAHENPHVLDEPKPLILVDDFAESCIKMQYSVWGLHEELIQVKQSIYEDVKKKFDEKGILYGLPRSEVKIVLPEELQNLETLTKGYKNPHHSTPNTMKT